MVTLEGVRPEIRIPMAYFRMEGGTQEDLVPDKVFPMSHYLVHMEALFTR